VRGVGACREDPVTVLVSESQKTRGIYTLNEAAAPQTWPETGGRRCGVLRRRLL